MEDDAQARAYAEADFEQPHAMFVRLLEDSLEGRALTGTVIDLGCGPADIAVRVARRFPDAVIDGVDGSEAMLKYGAERIRREGLGSRIRLMCGRLPDFPLPRRAYDAIVSNSLLHHLRDPKVLWDAIKRCARRSAPVFIMDLLRPESEIEALALVDLHAAGEPAVLRHDFFHSLLAAYRIEEVRAQLDEAGFGDFTIEAVSDRHWVVTGRAP
jgi:ubiquinone/menaquinone biosynthesis C-methylase UbiE